MANTLSDYSKLSLDIMLKGIIDTIIYESPLFDKLPFVEITGNSLLYNMESEPAGADWYQVGDIWKERTPNWAQRSVALTILGGDADVDNFARQTRSNVQDLEAAVIEKKAKAISYEFQKQLIEGQTYGYTGNEMTGLMRHLAYCETATATALNGESNSQVIATGATAVLALTMVDELIDKIKPGKPDFLMMSRAMRRKLTQSARAGGANLTYTTDPNRAGMFIEAYNGIPILINDWIPDDMNTSSTKVLQLVTSAWHGTNANSPIFAIKLGEFNLCGIQNQGIQREALGNLETKDAQRTRIKWYCGLANLAKLDIAVLLDASPA